MNQPKFSKAHLIFTVIVKSSYEDLVVGIKADYLTTDLGL